MEDDKHPGKLRKYQCCPVTSDKKSKKKNEKLVKGVAFVGDEDGDCESFASSDDFLDDDDDNDDDDDDVDDSHDDPPNPYTDQHDHFSDAESAQHAQSYEFVSDDEIVSDAGTHKTVFASDDSNVGRLLVSAIKALFITYLS